MNSPAAATPARGVILQNLQRVLGAQLAGLGWNLVLRPHFDAHTPDQGFTADLGVANVPGGPHTQAAAICAVFEILPPQLDSTTERARLEKIRRRSSVRDLVIITSTACQVEHWFRSERSPWCFELLTNATDAVPVRSLGISVGLDRIYLRVGLPRTPERSRIGS